MTRPPQTSPSTPALVHDLRSAALVATAWRGLLTRAADEITRLSALSLAAHEATHALVEQAAETERRGAQIQHLQDGLRDALATIARLRGIIDAGESEEVARLRWFAGKVVQEYRTAGPEVEEWGVAAGVMQQVTAAEPCDPDTCACAEFGFPTECYRLTPEVVAALAKVGP